jgi:heat shock protein HslJ
MLAAPLMFDGAAAAQGHALLGTQWKVVKVQGVDVPPGLTLRFETDRVEGSTGCNQFWAPVDYLTQPGIDIGAPQSKRLYCLGAMGVERAYLASLETISSYARSDDGKLKLMLDDGDVFVELTPAGGTAP